MNLPNCKMRSWDIVWGSRGECRWSRIRAFSKNNALNKLKDICEDASVIRIWLTHFPFETDKAFAHGLGLGGMEPKEE